MSVNLCIDLGNTQVKAAIVADDKIIKKVEFPAEAAHEYISAMLLADGPQKAILCSVRKDNDGLVQLLRSKIASTVVLNSNTEMPIHNAYGSADTLGADRLAMMVAANVLYPDKNNLVVSLGTCATYNLIQKNKTFRGGAISPGLRMRLRAMHEFTDMLPLVKELDSDPLLLGYDTDTCMQSGAANGMLAELDGMIRAYEERYTDLNTILTGGDGPYFATKLKSKIFADPDLLMKGLNIILNHNVPTPR